METVEMRGVCENAMDFMVQNFLKRNNELLLQYYYLLLVLKGLYLLAACIGDVASGPFHRKYLLVRDEHIAA